jgi:hypothetical protein
MEGEMVESLLVLPALGDVVRDDDDALRAAFGVADDATARFQQADAVDRQQAIFEPPAGAAGDDFAEGLDHPLAVGRMNVGERQTAGEVAVAEQLRVRRTVVHPSSVEIEYRHEAVEVLGDQAEELLLLAQRVFGELVFADIDVRNHGPAATAVERGDPHAEPARLIGRVAGVLQAEVRQAAVEHRPDAGQRLRAAFASPPRAGFADFEVVGAEPGCGGSVFPASTPFWREKFRHD